MGRQEQVLYSWSIPLVDLDSMALATVKRIDPTRIFYRRDICIPFLAITSGSVSTKCGWSVVYSAAAVSIDVVDDDHDQLTYDDIDGTWMGYVKLSESNSESSFLGH